MLGHPNSKRNVTHVIFCWYGAEARPVRMANLTFIPIANRFAAWLAERTGGVAQSSVVA
jgi:hypothetical protein